MFQPSLNIQAKRIDTNFTYRSWKLKVLLATIHVWFPSWNALTLNWPLSSIFHWRMFDILLWDNQTTQIHVRNEFMPGNCSSSRKNDSGFWNHCRISFQKHRLLNLLSFSQLEEQLSGGYDMSAHIMYTSARLISLKDTPSDDISLDVYELKSTSNWILEMLMDWIRIILILS